MYIILYSIHHYPIFYDSKVIFENTILYHVVLKDLVEDVETRLAAFAKAHGEEGLVLSALSAAAEPVDWEVQISKAARTAVLGVSETT